MEEPLGFVTDARSSLYGSLDEQMVAKHDMGEFVASSSDSDVCPV